jgi:hypothetical protein
MNPVKKILGKDVSNDRQLKPKMIGEKGTVDVRATCPYCHRILKHSYSGSHHQYFCNKCDYTYNFDTK